MFHSPNAKIKNEREESFCHFEKKQRKFSVEEVSPEMSMAKGEIMMPAAMAFYEIGFLRISF